MITFSVENWDDVKEEVKPLWLLHYDEVGQNKEKLKLDPDIEKLDHLNSLGKLHIVVGRREGQIVGYHASIIETLVHYKTVLVAMSDLYWLQKDCRNGTAALRLFQEVERSCKARGVKVLYDATKLYLDHGRLFEHLGYKPIERRYSKWIGD
jgi:hypothetical protein